MKIDRLDAHDRLLHFNKTQNLDISQCCQDLINKRPFGNHAFYIFGHARTEDNGVDKRLIWQPRLTKPLAQTNSMLFKVYPGTDLVKVIWMIPDRVMWEQYKKGNVTESEIITESIHLFQTDRALLEAPEPDDLTDGEIAKIYEEVSFQANLQNLGVRKKARIMRPEAFD
jgi:hypothetical protein